MNLDHLRYFVKLAEIRHYTRAAEQLCISQPSLSHAINQLETELGVPLFERSGRNTTLTRFGEEFLECAQRSLDTLDVGIGSLQRSARGEGVVRLGFLRTLGVDYIPGLTADFLDADPDCGIQFSFHSGLSGELIDGLLQRKFDLVFCSEPDPLLGLSAVPVTSQELVMIVPKNHPLAGQESVDLTDTLQYPRCSSRKARVCAKSSTECMTRLAVGPRQSSKRKRTRSSRGLFPRALAWL